MRPQRQTRGFSLIEVLIAIVVLAIGLLGLGMVFPVVARQQRIAQDHVRGLSAARSFGAAITNRAEFFQNDPNGLWEVADNLADNVTGNRPADSWMTATAGAVATNSNPFVLDPSEGSVFLFQNGVASEITVSERLYPAPFTSRGDPLFVNDFALRKIDDFTCEVAIFARRIDPGIRIPPPVLGRQFTLSNILTGMPGNAANFRRSPVAVDSRMRPTLTGADEAGRPNYSNLKILRFDERPGVVAGDFGGGNVNMPPGVRYTVETIISGDTAFRNEIYGAAGQPGQKFVDNMGTVHTVIRSERSTLLTAPLIVYLDKTLSPEADEKRLDGDLWVVFSPHVPSAVEVFKISR